MECNARWLLVAVQMLLAMLLAAEAKKHPGPTGYLVCDSGVTLQILQNRTVRGTTHLDDPFAVVQLIRSGSTRKVFIYGVKARKFLCMRPPRKAVVKKRISSEGCIFEINELPEYFVSFRQVVNNKTIYFGLTRSGKPRTGRKRSSRTKFTWTPINYKKTQVLRKSKDWLNLYMNSFSGLDKHSK